MHLKLSTCLMPLMMVLWHTPLLSQSNLSALEVLDASIQYHDPEGKLGTQKWKMNFEDSRPDGSIRKASFQFDPTSWDFSMERMVGENAVRLSFNSGNFEATLNGKTNFSEEQKEQFRLTKDRATMMRNYYHYLWSLPMKLKDEGTNIQDTVKMVNFFGKESLEIRVTYDESVGTDTWYFYFNPKSFALQGYRFYKDESANDGEYITLDGEVNIKGVRIPSTRKWYMHQDDRYLGEDRLVSIEFN